MALNAAQLAQRAGKLTGSRVACLMTGDAEKILHLWKEMIGEALPEDISTIWAVRLGECTEALNLEWFERKIGAPLSRQGEVVQHPRLPWAACTLDAWCEELKCPVEAKHCGGREPIETLLDRYAPQLQWECEVTGAKQAAISIILGAAEPVIEFVEANAQYQTEMVLRGQQFMKHVANRTCPVAFDPVPFPVDADRVCDMNGDPRWQRSAEQWLQVHGAAETAKTCEKILKDMVPKDARKCFGHGVNISRNRIGYLSLREDR